MTIKTYPTITIKKFKFAFAAAMIVLVLTGCVSVGTQVKLDQLSGFTKGSTTYSDVITRLGQPNTVSTKSNGARSATYTYIHSQARPETYIPFIGGFIGGSDSTMNTAEFIFDKEDKLLEYSLSESNYGLGTGFAAGTYRDRTPNQPKEAP